MIMACFMQPKAMPKRKMRVILRSTGRLTKILPRAVILSVLQFMFAVGDGIVSAPIYCRFLIVLKMSARSGGWIVRPKIISGSY